MKIPTHYPGRRPRLGAIVAFALTLGACNSMDSIADRFDKVSIGDSRSSVIAALGSPSSANTLEVPMVRLDSMAWKSQANGKVYLVLVALDRVVAKTAIQ